MSQNIVEIISKMNLAAPLNNRRVENFKSEISNLLINDKIDFLVYAFKNHEMGFTKSLALCFPELWEDFHCSEWQKLIVLMFPRETFNKLSFENLQTGSFTDILLINGIVGVNPFDFIFNTLEINEEQKDNFRNFLKFRGEYLFYANERELIEDIVCYYDVSTFSKIVNSKNVLLDNGFSPAMTYKDTLSIYCIEDNS